MFNSRSPSGHPLRVMFHPLAGCLGAAASAGGAKNHKVACPIGLLHLYI